jgi:uncharacterized membrane protein HdeD (DUF308 family)
MSSPAASDPLSELKSTGWLLIGAGAVAIVAGILAIAYPDITLLALAIFVGIDLIVISIVSLVDAFAKGADGGTRALSAILGVLGLIAGIVVLRRPGETLLVVILVVGIWLVVSGAISFFRAFETLDGRAFALGVAIAEILLGILILALPDVSLRTVAILAGISFILRGLLAVWGGWQLRKAGAAGASLAPAG